MRQRIPTIAIRALILGAFAVAISTTAACKSRDERSSEPAKPQAAPGEATPTGTAPADPTLAGAGDWSVSWTRYDPAKQRAVPKGCQAFATTGTVGGGGTGEGQGEDGSASSYDKPEAGDPTTRPESGISHNGFTPQCIVIGGVSWSEAWRDLARHWLSKLPIAEFPHVCEPGGPALVGYLARCALSESQTISFQCGAKRYEFRGQHGVAPAWFDNALDVPGRERVTACLMAHANQQGATVPIWMEGDFIARGTWTTASLIREGAFAGDLFVDDGQEIELLAFHAKGYTQAPSTSPGRVCTLSDANCGFDVSGTSCTRASTGDHFSACQNGAITMTNVLTTWLKKDGLSPTGTAPATVPHAPTTAERP